MISDVLLTISALNNPGLAGLQLSGRFANREYNKGSEDWNHGQGYEQLHTYGYPRCPAQIRRGLTGPLRIVMHFTGFAPFNCHMNTFPEPWFCSSPKPFVRLSISKYAFLPNAAQDIAMRVRHANKSVSDK